MIRLFRCLACFALVFGCMTQARAAIIISTLGNDAPGFSDGDFVGTVALGAAQAGSPSPFDPGNLANGNEVLGPNFHQMWTHSYGAIVDTILSATLKIGIHDSEGGSVGAATDGSGKVVTLADEQLDFYAVDGTSVKSLLLTDFEAMGQGLNGQYEEYEIILPGSLFADLADGSALIDLGLKGPVFSPRGLPFLPDIVNDFNAASLVFSKLTIETQAGGGGVVPEPGTMAIWSILAAMGLAYASRRRRSVAVE